MDGHRIPGQSKHQADKQPGGPAGDRPSDVDWSWPQVQLSGVTELRVHGVGGTPPQDMLDDPHPAQVSGDRIAGVMRAGDVVDADQNGDLGAGQGSRGDGTAGVLPGDAQPLRWHLEAYAWGGLTGRAISRALWLLVLPFAMVNMAGWMAPTRGQPVQRGAIRLMGLCVSALYVLFVAEMAMDFAAYQCASSAGCATYSWPLVGEGGVASTGARRAVVGAFAPVLLIGFLAVLTHVSRNRYEHWQAPQAGPDRPPAGAVQARTYDQLMVDEPTKVGLVDPSFWTGQGFAERLAELHVFAGLGLVAVLISATADMVTTSGLARPLWLLSTVLLLVAAGLTLSTRLRAWLPRGSATLLGVVLVVAAAVVAWTGGSNGRSARPLPGLLPAFDVVLGLALVAAVVLLVSGLLVGRAGPVASVTRLRQAFTPFSVVVVAGLLTTTLFSGSALWLANRLGDATSVGRGPQVRFDIIYPQPFEALARSLPALFVLGVLAGLAGGSYAWRRIGDGSFARLREAWSGAGAAHLGSGRTAGQVGMGALGDRSWEHKVARALRLPAASLAGLEWAVWIWAGLTSAGALAYGGVWLSGLIAHGNLTDYLDQHNTIDRAWWLAPLGFSTWLITFLPLGAAVVMRRTLTHPSARRLAAIAWDVSTFFPRAFHPLAPPCYAERAVPELQTRLQRLWGADGRVVLLGHSQGSVLVAAALASLPRDTPGLDRVALITYGCPLGRLYGRHFPAYFDDRFRNDVATVLGKGQWDNFFHDTDLVGHRVKHEGAPGAPHEHWLPDPASPLYMPGDQLPEVRGHGHHGYRRQAEFRRRVRGHVQALAQPGSSPGLSEGQALRTSGE